MKAVRIHQHGGPEQLRFEDVAMAPEAFNKAVQRVMARSELKSHEDVDWA